MDERSGDDLASGLDAGPHPGMKRLIAYREGTLPEAEREALQEHLSLCPGCTRLLRELRDFEAAAAGAVEKGPEPRRREAWESLVRRLPGPSRTSAAARPIATPPAGRRPASPFLPAAAAALLLAVIGLSAWSAVEVRQERRRVAALEERLQEREAALAREQRSRAGTERQLQDLRGRLQNLQRESAGTPRDDTRQEELQARIAELTRDLEELRRTARTQGEPDRAAAGPRVELSVSPRFVLRGQEPGGAVLRGGGAVNAVRKADRVTLAVDLPDQPAYPEYRFELLDQDGEVLWSGRRPGRSVLGDAGTALSASGLAPGSYRLRIEGLGPESTAFLGEYRLEVT